MTIQTKLKDFDIDQYDLTTEGVSFSEALCPQVQFDISPQDRAKIIASIRMGISVDMAEYGYPGIIFAPAN